MTEPASSGEELRTEDEMFAAVAVERRRVADVLETLKPQQLDTPSLCGEWTVREVAGHLLTGFEVSTLAMAKAMVTNRGNFNRANTHFARRLGSRDITDIVATLRANAEHRFTPPGAGAEAPLGDIVLHGQDMFRPLGIEHSVAEDRVRVILDRTWSPATRVLVPRKRLRDLTFVADDFDWRRGTGAEVTGPGLSLAMALWGRAAGLDQLSGAGKPVLAARLS